TLKENDQRFRTLAKICPIGIFRIDETGLCLYVNEQWSRITGRPPEDALGENWLDADHPDDRTKATDTIERSLRKQNELRLDCRLIDAEGEEVRVLFHAHPETDEEGALRGFVGTFTSLKNTAHTSRSPGGTSKIDSLGVLAGGIAHDFNNLLTPILLNLSIAQNQLHQPGYLAEIEKRLKEAEQAAIRAKTLTHELLTFAKSDTPKRKVVALDKLVTEAVSFTLHGSRVHAELDLPPDLWPVEVDPTQINQVILKVIINAAEAMPSGGTIHIGAENLEQIDDPALPDLAGRHICVRIADQGPGIAPEVLPRIFEPYYSTKPGASGLGLATALSIVRKHSGHLLVKSRPGEGAAFSIYLPATAESLQTVTAPAPAAKALDLGEGKDRILVMDDEELVRSSVRAILVALGFEVEVARDGQEALDIFVDAENKGCPIDLTLMDLTIQGGMGGREAVAELKALDPGAKAVVCSGYSNDPIMSNYSEYGFNGAIQKPFHPDELCALITEVIHG
ncbi:MAG: ATP-binding protein, partial [Verrucomicrobiales bacterium]